MPKDLWESQSYNQDRNEEEGKTLRSLSGEGNLTEEENFSEIGNLKEIGDRPLTPLEAYLRGFRKGSPILMGLIPFALIYGAAARDAGLTLIETVSMSLTIFAGSAQLVFLRLWDARVSIFILALTVSAVNLRLLIYGSSLQPYVGPASSKFMGLVRGYFLTDESYSISMAHFLKTGDLRRATYYYLGAAGPTYFGWQLTGILGYLGGTLLPPSLPFKMAIPMVFLTLLISVLQASSKRLKHKIIALLTSGVAAIVLRDLLPQGVGIIAAIVAGVLLGYASLYFSGEPFEEPSEEPFKKPYEEPSEDAKDV